MSKELTFTDDNTVKYLDTSSSFDLAITEDGSAFDLTNATAIDVKVANASGYVFDKSIDMTTVTQPLAGVITMPVDAEVMNTLTPDDYKIEVWVTLSSLITASSTEGTNVDTDTSSTTSSYTAIFPSDDTVGFTINSNLTNVDGKTVDTISLATFEGELNGKADDSTVLHNDTLNSMNQDDSGIIIGSDQDFGLIKRNGHKGGLAIGSDNNFHFMATTDTTLSNTSLYTDVWSIGSDGKVSILGGTSFTPADDSKVVHLSMGATTDRPTGQVTGYQYFDTTLNKPIWYTGTAWVDATGTTV
ncbi:hypothetical protein [Secundilactobacillus collinoides]|uniref:hypothetical protein n=1 Tax=Secundilactobacillus collinoides TaxID=33960 RepID=UPI0007AEBA93|nr:hypothetical protein [Secundilactobacillus collinoides]